jgi:hypothetical protein
VWTDDELELDYTTHEDSYGLNIDIAMPSALTSESDFVNWCEDLADLMDRYYDELYMDWIEEGIDIGYP